MAFTLFATIENKKLKLAWNDGVTRLPPYCVLLSSILAHSQAIRNVLGEFTLNNIRADSLDYGPYFERLLEAGSALRKALFAADDNPAAADEAEALLRQRHGRPELSIFSEVCVPWGFVLDGAAQYKAKLTNTISDFEFFWSSQFVLTLRGGQSWRMEAEPRKRDNFRMLHALHRDRFNAALGLLSEEQRKRLEGLVDRVEVGNVTSWSDCRERWATIQENDSLLHIFGHSDGEKIYLRDPAGGAPTEDAYCLEADRFRSLFVKERYTRSVTICFLNGCRTGAGPVGESFLDVLFARGFQGFIGTEAEVSNKFAAEYATEFMSRLWFEGASVRETFDLLRSQLFPLSMMYSCYAHPEFRIETPPRSLHAESHRACA